MLAADGDRFDLFSAERTRLGIQPELLLGVGSCDHAIPPSMMHPTPGVRRAFPLEGAAPPRYPVAWPFWRHPPPFTDARASCRVIRRPSAASPSPWGL